MRKIFLLFVILLLMNGTTMSQEQEQSITVNATVSTFISRWNTELTSSGSSDSNQIKLPLESSGNYNFVVNWGDGSSDNITSHDQTEVIHTYSSKGLFDLTVDGTLNGWRFANSGDRLKIMDISQWGNLQLGNSGWYFYGAENLQISAIDAPDLSGTTNFVYMFHGAYSFNSDISNWDVSSVTNMYGAFYGAVSFNQNIGNWDVSSVIDMGSMLRSTAFNQDIGNWDVSSVTDMDDMFRYSRFFNQDIGNWDVSSVTNMLNMFYNVTLSTENYDNLLLNWAELQLQNGVNFNAGDSKYSSLSADSRQKIINTFGWTIVDGGEGPVPSSSENGAVTSETTESEIVETSILQFYSLFSLIVFVVIRIGIIKKKKL